MKQNNDDAGGCLLPLLALVVYSLLFGKIDSFVASEELSNLLFLISFFIVIAILVIIAGISHFLKKK